MIAQESSWACVWRCQRAERGRGQELQNVPLTHLDHADGVVLFPAHPKTRDVRMRLYLGRSLKPTSVKMRAWWF
jgi:hypothetical protein